MFGANPERPLQLFGVCLLSVPLCTVILLFSPVLLYITACHHKAGNVTSLYVQESLKRGCQVFHQPPYADDLTWNPGPGRGAKTSKNPNKSVRIIINYDNYSFWRYRPLVTRPTDDERSTPARQHASKDLTASVPADDAKP